MTENLPQTAVFSIAGIAVEGVEENGEIWLGVEALAPALGFSSADSLRKAIAERRDLLAANYVRKITVQTSSGAQPKTFINRGGVVLIIATTRMTKTGKLRDKILQMFVQELSSRVHLPRRTAKEGAYPVTLDQRLMLESLLATPLDLMVSTIQHFLKGNIEPIRHPVIDEILERDEQRGKILAQIARERHADERILAAINCSPDIIKPMKRKLHLKRLASVQPRLALESAEADHG